MHNTLRFAWVLVLVSVFSLGCATATRTKAPATGPAVARSQVVEDGPGSVPANGPSGVKETEAFAKTMPASPSVAVAKPKSVEASIPAGPPPQRCELPDAGEAYGLYRTDAWPRGQVVLTFDDGPHPTITPRVLDLLAKHDMQATFFVVGRAINRKTFHLVQRMVADGHTLGVHSYNHDVGMSKRVQGERTIAYITGQHAVTQLLVDLALLATSADHFDQLYRRVFERDPLVYLSSSSLRTDLSQYVSRHERLLAEYGFGPGERVYPVLYSRPPGGAPYLGQSPAWATKGYDEALGRLGMLNVMWHGGSGDTDPEKRSDFGFLYANIRHHARRGGVLLLHDYIRRDALAAALDFISKDASIRVVPIDEAVERKYGCAAWALRDKLVRPQPAPVIARVDR